MSELTGLHIARESDVLVVRATGRFLIENTEEAANRLADAIKEWPVTAALLDFREITGEISFMDRYRLGKIAGSYLRRIPLAVLVKAEQMDKERIGLAVARNRGANIELFTEPPAAEAWIAAIPGREKPPGSV